MGEMIERVARAISVPQHHTTWDLIPEVEKALFYMQARTAMETVRQELAAFTNADKFDEIFDRYDSGELSFASAFRLLIDAALAK